MASHDDSAPRFEYFRGYPGRFRRDRRDSIRGALIWPGVFFLASLTGVAASTFTVSTYALQSLSDPHFSQDVSRDLLGGICFLVPLSLLAGFSGWGVWANLHPEKETTIVPYFQKQLGEIHTFAQGHAIAKNCQKLDELALRAEFTPLSAFGFNDDLAGEELTWHAAQQGLATITGLLLALRQSSQRCAQHEQLLNELTAVQHALQRASDQGVPFCLLLRTTGFTSGQEWEVRKGSCF